MGWVSTIGKCLMDEIGNIEHFVLLHSTGCHSGGTQTDSAGFKGGSCVEGDGVLINCNSSKVESLLGELAINAVAAKVDEHQMVFGGSRDDAVTIFLHPFAKRLGVVDYLELVILERRRQCLAKTDGFGSDNVHQWSPLNSWEQVTIDLLGVLRLAQDQSPAWPAEGFVGGGCDEVGIGHRGWVDTGGDQSGDMSHVDH